MKLDGTDKITPTPFDAHEKVVRESHSHSVSEGYQAAEYQHAEYPKHVKVGDETVIVANAEEEAAAKKVVV